MIMDGRGAWEATSIWHGKNGRIEHVQTIPFPNSIGGFYSAFTEYLGFVPNTDEWKVMGLAPYGEPGVKLDVFHHAGNEQRHAIPRAHKTYQRRADWRCVRNRGGPRSASRGGE